MRISAFIRIIIWLLIAVLLVSLLVVGLTGAGISWLFRNIEFPFSRRGYMGYDDSRYTIGTKAVVDSTNIDSVEVDWLAGHVEVALHDGGDIEFYESGSGTLTITPDYQMRYSVDGRVLKIRFARPGVNFIGVFRNLSKTLTLSIPKALYLERLSVDTVSASVAIYGLDADSIAVNTTSGRIAVSDVGAESLRANTVSGRVELSKVNIGEARIQTISGRIEANGEFESFVSDSVSGASSAECAEMPRRVTMETVSGSITLRIPENDGFEVRYKRVSGSFNCDFEVTHSGNKAIHKDGGAVFSFSTVSGGMNIRKN